MDILYQNAFNYVNTVNANIQSYIFEAWVPLIWNGIVVDRYYISNYGRLYDNEKHKLVGYSIDKDGYFMASIKIPSIGYKKIRVHRFELMSFYYNDNFMNLQVNHKDGNKQNLMIWNLEWATPQDNTRHGWDHGLNTNIGINNGNAIYDDSIIHEICECIDLGLTNSQVCDHFNIYDKANRMKLSATVSGIRYGKCHRNISSQYKFLNGIDKSNRYSLEFAELVCQFLSDPDNKYTYKEIMDYLNIPNEDRVMFKIYIDDLIRKRTALPITEKYNLAKPLDGNNINAYLMR